MPYIGLYKREILEPVLSQLHALLGDPCIRPGVFNYAVTVLLTGHGTLSYARINAIVGILECIKLELYRRQAAPYEDTKCQQNGDVYADA